MQRCFLNLIIAILQSPEVSRIFFDQVNAALLRINAGSQMFRSRTLFSLAVHAFENLFCAGSMV